MLGRREDGHDGDNNGVGAGLDNKGPTPATTGRSNVTACPYRRLRADQTRQHVHARRLRVDQTGILADAWDKHYCGPCAGANNDGEMDYGLSVPRRTTGTRLFIQAGKEC